MQANGQDDGLEVGGESCPSAEDGSSSAPGGVPSWLSPRLTAWASANREGLEAILTSFVSTGAWPDPVELQRELRASGGPAALSRVAREIPVELGYRQYQPPEVRLSLFGVACCQGGRRLLDAYFRVLRLAITIHSTPSMPNRLARGDIARVISDPALATLVNALILADAPFLGSGSSGHDDWDREIDERVVEYENARSADAFLALLAVERGAALPTEPPARGGRAFSGGAAEVGSDEPQMADGMPHSHATVRDALLTVTGVVGTLLAVALAPLALGLAAAAACASFVALAWWKPAISTTTAVLGAAAISAICGGIGLYLGGRGDAPSPVSAQLDGLLREARGNDRFPASRRVGRLHPEARRTHLFVFRDIAERSGAAPTDFAAPPSDELRIYDEVSGQLRPALRFQPQNPGELQQGPDGDAPGYRIRIVDLVDVNEDDTAEVLLSFERATLATGPLPLPALAWWDHVRGQYQLDLLISDAPEIAQPSGLATSVLDGYRDPSRIRDQFSGLELVGHPADLFEIRRALRGPVLVAGFAEDSPSGFTGRYEAKGWFVHLDGRGPRTEQCTVSGRHAMVEAPSPAQTGAALAAAVVTTSRNSTCGQP